MKTYLKVLLVDAASAFYRVNRYPLGEPYFGPVDLGIHLSGLYKSLNMGVGLLAGSIFPGSNRMIFTGFSPNWTGFYISSMGGAGLVFDNLGINMLTIVGKAAVPSVLLLNRSGGEEIDVRVEPVDIQRVWSGGRRGIYALMDYVHETYGEQYSNDPRILAVGPAAAATDFGAIASVPIDEGKLSVVDTWAGRGGFGSKLLQEHGIAAVIYGGTFIDEDFRDRKVADQWFIDKYQKKLAAKDLEATAKYRFEPNFQTGGTLGVNFATLGGQLLSFNYRSIFMEEEERLRIHREFIVDHYLKQFNEETIRPKNQKNCGEPCVAVCKKLHGEFKKDYEPYQVMGPQTGIFDQRAAERLNHHADMYGFDAISAGGVLAWLMECLDSGLLTPQDLGVSRKPVFHPEGFDLVADSRHNAELGVELLDAMIEKRGLLDLSEGARVFAWRLSGLHGKQVVEPFVYTAYARRGWMVPNQYWTPGALSPMAIMGKYYMHYGSDFIPPRELGRKNAKRLQQELILDNLGTCRFHRGWAEEMIPEIMESLFGLGERYTESIRLTAGRINSRNSSVFWESQRCIDIIGSFLKRKRDVEGSTDACLAGWIKRFEENRREAALEYWYDIHKGIQESLGNY